MEPLIAANQLLAHSHDTDWATIDCRFYLAEPHRGEREYLLGHIPGAVYAHLDRDLSAPPSGTNGRHPLPSIVKMTDRFSQWGIDEAVRVIVYDTAGGQIAARLWWMLRFLGHDAVSVLDGGLAAYEASGGPLARNHERRSPRRFEPRVREAMRIDVDALRKTLENHLLLDARAPERFRGDAEPLDPVAGHIPGARNLPSSTNLDERGRFLPEQELRKRFSAVIEGGGDSVVSYCGSGVTACHNLLAMEIAGLTGAKLYPGSWSEWCADRERPIAIGDA
ncbi:MAG TPA: sulfurtransferase [Vicinamibacteria bacterium]|nr:sulfurtransferase [Vicinamibacteria bacterium]